MRKLPLLTVLCALLGAGDASAMSYGLAAIHDGRCSNACPLAIVASGTIQRNEAEQFLALQRSTAANGGAPHSLIVSSPGGDLVGALELGLNLRRLGIRTTVGSVAQSPYDGRVAVLTPGVCGSACVFVLMAGVSRHLVPGSRVAVHSPRVIVVGQTQSFALGGPLARVVIKGAEPVMQLYARGMGVDPALITLADRVPNETRLTLSPTELSRYRLITEGRPVRSRLSRAPRKPPAQVRGG